ncbi:MAG: [protein-PII] uridylyltransferase [Mariprofundaceae bacterium]|nr:[protein-PII] uridylyltransferase [Mariprofundaceae bacterium]
MGDARQELKNLHDQTCEMFDAGSSGELLVQHMCNGVDTLLARLWQESAPHAAAVVDLVAVGGYGRGELAPQSDWDIWFLVPEQLSSELEKEIETFLYALWDLNIKLGHAVRSVKETMSHLKEDWNSATAAMESRLLCGNGELYENIQDKLKVFFKKRRKAFVEAKFAELKARHQRTGGTAFLMEPDIKEGQGGLRDIQAIFWIAKAWHSSDVKELVDEQVISQVEHDQLMEAQEFLWRCRVGLHLENRRAGDRLGFEQQAALTGKLGYGEVGQRPAVEVFMKDYFRHVGRVVRVTSMLLLHFQERLHPQLFSLTHGIGDGFTLEGQRVGIENNQVFKQDLLRLLRVFHVAQKDHRRLSSAALRQIRADVLLIDDNFRADPEAHSAFLAILRDRRNVAWALKEMNDTGVLGRFIPEFREVVGLGQFNRYHAYTVDEHTIRAVGEARNMFHKQRDRRLPLAHEVCHKIRRPELLYIALIFHDIAKGVSGDHSENGEVMARSFCQRIGLNRDATELVSWLVREHLYMAVLSQRSDLSDPEVIRGFANRVGDSERLNYLLLLTVADISAVGPGVWNDWKGALLRELYHSTLQLLMGEGIEGEALKQRIETRLESTLAKAGKERAAMEGILKVLPWRCIMHFPPRQLYPLGSLLLSSEGGDGVDLFTDEVNGETMAMVVARARSGIFAALTGCIASGHINVVAAQAYELLDGRVLDLFHIQDGEGDVMTRQQDLQRLKGRISKLLESDDMNVRPNIPRCRPTLLMREVAARVRELPHASSRQTAIEVAAADRPGLLAQLSDKISELGFDIRGAAISTFGERVVDVFFLRGKESWGLSTDEVELLCSSLIEVARLPEE